MQEGSENIFVFSHVVISYTLPAAGRQDIAEG